jgi:hypothetical protein
MFTEVVLLFVKRVLVSLSWCFWWLPNLFIIKAGQLHKDPDPDKRPEVIDTIQ